MGDAVATFLGALGGLVAAGLGALVAWVRLRRIDEPSSLVEGADRLTSASLSLVTTMREQMRHMEGEIADLRGEVRQLRDELARRVELAEEVRKLKTVNVRLVADVDRLEDEVHVLTAELARAREPR